MGKRKEFEKSCKREWREAHFHSNIKGQRAGAVFHTEQDRIVLPQLVRENDECYAFAGGLL
jgi:hypothetical protein